MSRVLPILFNTEMVRAILDGRKTVTRRVVKFPTNKYTNKMPNADKVSVYSNTLRSEKVSFHEEPFYCFDVKPPYQPGDILYVRETWSRLSIKRNAGYTSKRYVYKASDQYPFGEKYIVKFRWRPSIHMPKEAARIWLKVADVRVERLQDIDDDGVVAEGLQIGDPFDELWDSTIKKENLDRYGWDANPWVWVIEFERCEKPID